MRSREPGIMLRGKVWYARVQRDGKDVWKAAGPTRQEALELRARMLQEAARVRVGLPVPPKGSAVPFRDVARDFLAWAKDGGKRSWKRDETSLKHLLPFFGDKPLTAITPRAVDEYRAARRTETTCRGAPPSNPTLNREVRCLTRILRFAVERGMIPESPLKRLHLPPESPPRVPVLDADAEARLIAALPPWARLPVTLALRTGARAGEILAARWKHLDLEAGTWTIPDSKNLSPRTIPLSPSVLEMLRPRRGTPDGWVVTLDGRPVSVCTLSQVFRRATRRIGRPDLRLHDCRHVFASALLARGASLVEIGAALGHKTLSVAARYSHASPERLRALVDALPPAPVPAPPVEIVDLRKAP